ncbi:hypothetical protein QFZ69_000454 [Arthrobacter sp. V1I7]|nr:hypothetical protein [Arthrobacter sp. V1I7]
MAVIEQVYEGMHVVGPDGKKVGKVEDLKMGDPEAVTSDGQTDPETGGLVGSVIDDFARTSRLPRHTAERLLADRLREDRQVRSVRRPRVPCLG